MADANQFEHLVRSRGSPIRVLLALLLAGSGGATASADGTDADLPGAPRPLEELEPALALGVRAQMVLPLSVAPLCPTSADCVLEGAAGLALDVQRRWPAGFGFGLGWDAWFVDSSGVYELGVMHTLRAEVRQRLLPRRLVHPFGAASLDALIFGDGFRVGTVGFGVDLVAGLEIELTEGFALVVASPVRAFLTGSFETPRDGVARGQGRGVNATVAVEVGLVAIEAP